MNDLFTVDDLVRLLGAKVEAAAAKRALLAAAQRVGHAYPLSRDQALAVLEEMTNDGSVLGVVARFAKARVILM